MRVLGGGGLFGTEPCAEGIFGEDFGADLGAEGFWGPRPGSEEFWGGLFGAGLGAEGFLGGPPRHHPQVHPRQLLQALPRARVPRPQRPRLHPNRQGTQGGALRASLAPSPAPGIPPDPFPFFFGVSPPLQELGNSLDKCKNNENVQQILTNATIMVVSVTASTTQG